MSSYLNKQWAWDLSTVNDGTGEADVNVYLWNTAGVITHIVTDSNGSNSAYMTEADYTIDNTDDVTENKHTPHVLSICKYGVTPKALNIAFVSSRVDTFYISNNPYVTESDAATVAGYTGIDIDHTNKIITITEGHTVNELYDYCQYDMTQNPIKEFPEGILTTNNGSDYTLVYDLTVDGVNLAGTGKYIDMHNNTFTLSNSGSTSAKVRDINGVLVTFGLTGLQDNSEVRVYKKSDMSELAGIEDSGSSFTYNYNYTEDVDIIVVVYAVGYNPIRIELTLGSSDNSIPIQQQKDRWYKND